MSYMLPHLDSGYAVDQAILSEEERVVIIRFGHDWDPVLLAPSRLLSPAFTRVLGQWLVPQCKEATPRTPRLERRCVNAMPCDAQRARAALLAVFSHTVSAAWVSPSELRGAASSCEPTRQPRGDYLALPQSLLAVRFW